MIKTVINVPKGIDYFSEWDGFKLLGYPHILNKQITGCGFTSWVLSNNQNIILCSPRKALLESKLTAYNDLLEKLAEDKLPEPPYRMYYAKNEFEKISGLDRDLNVLKTSEIDSLAALNLEREKLSSAYTVEFKDKVISFAKSCHPLYGCAKNCKIIVTYDSFRKVREALEYIEVFQNFYVVVDEFQSIFTDSRFKSDTEMDLLKSLSGIDNLCFVSATPMIDTYLEQTDEFKDLPYIDLDWGALDPSRVIKPRLSSTPCSNINQKAKEIIEKYRAGNWRDSDNNTVRRLNSFGQIEEIHSREAVFFINSVKNICDIIKGSNLTQEECNVICAKTPSNEDKIRKAFKVKKADFKGIGKVPGKKDMANNKMFTFCTRTVYLGADFYSDNARTFIFSDANIDTLAVDITLDLPQILGRQRLSENPWCNSAVIYYKPLKEKTDEDFQKIIVRKKEETNSLLRTYEVAYQSDKFSVAKNYRRLAEVDSYRDNYVAVNHHGGSTLTPKFNNLVMLSEIRAYEIQKLDYVDRVTVRNTINRRFGIAEDQRVVEVLSLYEKSTTFEQKIKLICDVINTGALSGEMIDYILSLIDDYITNYVYLLGPDKIKALSYRRTRLDGEVNRRVNNQSIDTCNIQSTIFSSFSIQDRLSKVDLKLKLKDLYDKLGLQKTAKATDLEEWFVTKPCKIRTTDDKRSDGFELVSVKSEYQELYDELHKLDSNKPLR